MDANTITKMYETNIIPQYAWYGVFKCAGSLGMSFIHLHVNVILIW